MSLKITQQLCHSSNYKKSRSDKIQFIVMHYTANNGDTAKGNVSYFYNNANLAASAHYFVDENSIYQSVLDKDTAWHCGGKVYLHDKCRNSNSIGIEMCSYIDKSGNYYIEDKTVENAILLVKELMKKYSINNNHVFRHYDITGKKCPAPWVSNSTLWRSFLDRLIKGADEMSVKEKDNIPAEWEKDAVNKALDKGILKGNVEGDLMLHSELTRAQLFVFLDRLRLLD